MVSYPGMVDGGLIKQAQLEESKQQRFRITGSSVLKGISYKSVEISSKHTAVQSCLLFPISLLKKIIQVFIPNVQYKMVIQYVKIVLQFIRAKILLTLNWH